MKCMKHLLFYYIVYYAYIVFNEKDIVTIGSILEILFSNFESRIKIYAFDLSI